MCVSTSLHKSEYWHSYRTAREHNTDINCGVLCAQSRHRKSKYDAINANPNIYVIYTSLIVMQRMWYIYSEMYLSLQPEH
jgi:hypothetical protein